MAAQLRKIAYVTGASRGIGEALIKKLLSENYVVVGLSRTTNFSHPNFKAITIDLADLMAVKKFVFSENAEHVLLVNNAGVLGDIGPVGSLNTETFEKVMNVNVIAPQILSNAFMATYIGNVASGHILNISSGAGKNPIDGWATYCASKAAIDLFSETIRKEIDVHKIENWFIHSIAPGVVDTAMQSEIRTVSEEKFSSIQRFKDLKVKNQLSAPKDVADQLMKVIAAPHAFEKTIFSVRDY